MRSLLALIVAAAVWTAPSVLTADAAVRTTITVRVYQTAGLSFTLEQRALAEAGAVLRGALVDVVWRGCSGPNRSAACDVRPDPLELSLRIVREGPFRRDASVTLGNAFVNPRVGGVLATVYFDRVEGLARVSGADAGVLLGRAAAHELAHLLMRTTAHPTCGLMRPEWTPHEVRRNRALDWTLTAGDVAALYQLRVSH